MVEGDVAFSRAILPADRDRAEAAAWAKAGLPIVLVGNWSAPTVSGIAKPGENATLKTWSTELLAQPTVRNVADRA